MEAIDSSTQEASPRAQRRALWMLALGAAAGLIFAGIMGLVGGFLPAVRASRLGIVDALRTA